MIQWRRIVTEKTILLQSSEEFASSGRQRLSRRGDCSAALSTGKPLTLKNLATRFSSGVKDLAKKGTKNAKGLCPCLFFFARSLIVVAVLFLKHS